MLDRAIHDSETRQEMISSVLLATSLDNQIGAINEEIGDDDS